MSTTDRDASTAWDVAAAPCAYEPARASQTARPMMQTQALPSDQRERGERRQIAHMSRSPSQRKHLAKSLGWAGTAIGIAELAIPGMLIRGIGVPDGRLTRWALLACGVREIITGIGAATSSRPRKWMSARLVGDIIDLALLGSAFASRRGDRSRLAYACAAVGVIMVLDTWALARLGRQAATSDAGMDRDRIEQTRAVTILGSRQEIERCWQLIRDESPRRHSEPIFAEAPGDRGIEVRILTGKLRARAVEAKLRRLKQLVEAGEVIESDASVHRFRHPARPSKRAPKEPRGMELLR